MARRITFQSEISSVDVGETFTIAVMGDSGVGKSTVVSRLLKHWAACVNIKTKKGMKSGDDLGIKGRDLIFDIMETSSKKWFSFMEGLPTCDVFVLVYSLVNDKSFESVCAVREQILQKKGPDAPIVFVANKTDIADSVDKNERVYRDLNISCEWEHGHEEISAEQDDSVNQVLEQIIKRYHKFSSKFKESSTSSVKSKLQAIKNFFSRK